MNDRKRTWWLHCIVAVCIASGLNLAAARTFGDEPKPDEKKQAEPVKDAPKADEMNEDQPVPEKMTPRRNREAVPQPTVQLKPGEMPIATFETPVYDFGQARAGTEITHDYKFKNTGTGDLEILRVKPGCGCTTAGEHTKIVKPGGEGVIPIKLKPGDHAGPVNKRITVSTNIPGKDSTIILEIKGTVWSPVQVTPRSAAFGRLTPDRAAAGTTRTLTIVNNLDAAMKPGAVSSSNDGFVGELKPLEDGKKYELIVTLTDKIVGGNNSAKLMFDTGLEDPKSVDVQAYAFMSPPVDVTPAKLVLPKPRSAELVRTFYIRSNTPKALEVTDLKCTTDALKLELVDLRGDKRTYRLSVTIPAAYEPPAQGDEISFKTDEPSMPIGSIPVTGTLTTGDQPMPTKS
ncbi:MAG: DUF1573 domain-containing protein [Phycisphaerales bacterium]|nr:DUF1573 domain-containing protein [Phycisphaerales bacterium]MCB9862188.1 DUF1573 domain-containing protein [Phycisphaerales bacterium]